MKIAEDVGSDFLCQVRLSPSCMHYCLLTVLRCEILSVLHALRSAIEDLLTLEQALALVIWIDTRRRYSARQ